VGVFWGRGLIRRFAFGVAVIAASVMLSAAQSSRAQNPTQPPPAQPPAPSSPNTAPGASPSPSTAPVPDSNPATASSHGKHTVTVTFDYDFGKTPACTATIKTGCVQQFIAYDISVGTKNPTMLFPIALPANPVGIFHGITATSPLLDFESGKHLISVSAMTPDGHHSRRSLCTTWIVIP
jgi:hypothetical protein